VIIYRFAVLSLHAASHPAAASSSGRSVRSWWPSLLLRASLLFLLLLLLLLDAVSVCTTYCWLKYGSCNLLADRSMSVCRVILYTCCWTNRHHHQHRRRLEVARSNLITVYEASYFTIPFREKKSERNVLRILITTRS